MNNLIEKYYYLKDKNERQENTRYAKSYSKKNPRSPVKNKKNRIANTKNRNKRIYKK